MTDPAVAGLIDAAGAGDAGAQAALDRHFRNAFPEPSGDGAPPDPSGYSLPDVITEAGPELASALREFGQAAGLDVSTLGAVATEIVRLAGQDAPAWDDAILEGQVSM